MISQLRSTKHYRCIRRGWVLLPESQRLLTKRTKLGFQNKAERRLHTSPLFSGLYLKSHMDERNGKWTWFLWLNAHRVLPSAQICLPPSCTQVPHARSGVMITKQSIIARRRLLTDCLLYVTHANDLTVHVTVIWRCVVRRIAEENDIIANDS